MSIHWPAGTEGRMDGNDLTAERILQQLSQLSPLEIKILHLKCQDKKHEEIGARLGYAPSTINDYVSAIYEKMGFNPQWHWRKRLAFLREHYCQSVADVHDGRVSPGSQPEASPPQPMPHWIELVRQEERENQETWDQVFQPDPPLRTARTRSRLDFFRLLELFLVAGTCAFVLWLAVNFLFAPLSLALLQASTPTSTSAPMSLPLTGLEKPVSSTEQPVTLLSSTPGTAPASTPDGNILYSNTFDTFPKKELISGNAFVVNGRLVAQNDSEFAFGDVSWTDYLVSFHVSQVSCGNAYSDIVVGLRYDGARAFGVEMCDDRVVFMTNKLGNMRVGYWEWIPNAIFEGHSGIYEVSVKGDEFRYGQNYLAADGYNQGMVYLRIPDGVSIDDLVIKTNP